MRRRLRIFLTSYSGVAAIVGTASLLLCVCYSIWWKYIPAPYNWMADCADILYPILQSIVASCVFYFVTVYFPYLKKRKKEENNIRRWIQQLVFYGDCLIEDISGEKQCPWEEFQKVCNKDLMNDPILQTICLREGRQLQNWFEYFDNHFYWIEFYSNKLLQYESSLPPEIKLKMDDYLQLDNLKSAVHTYKTFYDCEPIYHNMSGFARLIWNRAESLRSLDDLYIDNAKI